MLFHLSQSLLISSHPVPGEHEFVSDAYPWDLRKIDAIKEASLSLGTLSSMVLKQWQNWDQKHKNLGLVSGGGSPGEP